MCSCNQPRRNVGTRTALTPRAAVRQAAALPSALGMVPAQPPESDALTADRRRIDSLRREAIRRNLGIG